MGMSGASGAVIRVVAASGVRGRWKPQLGLHFPVARVHRKSVALNRADLMACA